MTCVVVPYVHGMLNAGTYRAVQYSGLKCRFIDIDQADRGAYGRLVIKLWQEAESIVIVEHDVIPTQHQLRVLVDCEHDWCSYDYASGPYQRSPMFGCVRLSGALMARHPMAAEVALITGKRRDQEADWSNVDSLMARDLFIRGETWYQHEPAVAHAHVGPPSGPP